MLKKTIFLAAALALSSTVMAQNAYVGVGAGQSTVRVTDEASAGLSVVKRDQDDTGYKVYGGYQFSQNFGVEVGYADLGKIKNTYSYLGVQGDLNVKTNLVYVAGTATLPLGDFGLFAKLGVSGAHTSGSVTVNGRSFSASGDQSGLLLGVGAKYNVTKNFGVAVEYEDFGKVASDVKATMWTISGRVNF